MNDGVVKEINDLKNEVEALKSTQAVDGKAIVNGFYHQFSTPINVVNAVGANPTVRLHLHSNDPNFTPTAFWNVANKSGRSVMTSASIVAPGKGKNVDAMAQGYVIPYIANPGANTLVFNVFAAVDFTGNF